MKRLSILLLALFLPALPVIGQDLIGPPLIGDQSIDLRNYPGKVFARLGTVPRRVAIDIRQIVPVAGSSVTVHTFLWSTTGNATINVDIESSTDCVNWDSVAADQTTESDSYTFEGGFCAVAITVDALSAGYTDISYIGISAQAGSSTGMPSNTRIQDGDSVTLVDVFSPTGDTVSTVATSSMAAASLNHAYNSSSAVWERIRTASSASGTTGTGLLGVGLLGFDGTNNSRIYQRGGDGDASGTAAIGLVTHAQLTAFNGTNWDRGRTIDGAASTGLGTIAVSQAPNVEGAAATTIALTSTLAATVFAIKASAGNLYGYDIFNDDTANCFCQIFNVAAASVTLGTTVPILAVGVKGDDRSSIMSSTALSNFGTAISAAFTTTATGNTACPTVGVANFFYK